MLSWCEDSLDTGASNWSLLPPEKVLHTTPIGLINSAENEITTLAGHEPVGLREAIAKVTDTVHI